MKTSATSLLFAIAVILSAPVSAQALSLILFDSPHGSVALDPYEGRQSMAETWNRASEPSITLSLYPGGGAEYGVLLYRNRLIIVDRIHEYTVIVTNRAVRKGDDAQIVADVRSCPEEHDRYARRITRIPGEISKNMKALVKSLRRFAVHSFIQVIWAISQKTR